MSMVTIAVSRGLSRSPACSWSIMVERLTISTCMLIACFSFPPPRLRQGVARALLWQACAGLRRNHGEQQVCLAVAPEVQGGGAAEDVRRAVARIVVQEGAAAPELVLEVGETPAARPGVFVVLAPDRQPQAATCRQHDRARPDLDVELHHLAGFQRLLAVVR